MSIVDKRLQKDRLDCITRSFGNIFNQLRAFRKENNLKTIPVDRVHEIYTALTDKHGRMARHVKHVSRGDPKPNFPKDFLDNLGGYLIYISILLECYNLSGYQVADGVVRELKKAIKQHSKK